MTGPTPAEIQAHVLVDELVRNGVRHVAISPGSRSAALALAFAHHSAIKTHVALDERSAAFFALGIGKATRCPAAVVSTSGTAAANFFPAVQEANHWRVPLIVLTADRPPELRDTGANQTIDQIKIYGDSVRWFAEIGVPEGQLDAEPNVYWRSLACRAVAMATGSPRGPVHLNIAMREPLVSGERIDDGDFPGRSNGHPWTVFTPDHAPERHLLPKYRLTRLAHELSSIERGAIVAGANSQPMPQALALADALGWPLLADPLSMARHEGAISAYDALLRSEAFAHDHVPEIVLRFGALGISKSLAAFAARAERHILIDPDGRWLDADRSVTDIVQADVGYTLAGITDEVTPATGTGWLESWREADAIAQDVFGSVLSREISEPAVARTVVDALPDGAVLVVGASMPFRDIEWFTTPRAGINFYGNRGANGIDGFVSTTLGIARATLDTDHYVARPTVGLCGDLTLLHDANGFLLDERPHATFVVLNNDGGGIFSILPQAKLPDHFEKLFGTPHGRNLERLAEFQGLGYEHITSLNALRAALARPGGTRLLEVKTDREANVAIHHALNAQVAEALSKLRH